MNSQQTVWVVSNINKEKLLPLKVDQVQDLHTIPANPPFALILSKSEQQDWFDLVQFVRSNKAYRFIPLFYHGDIEPHLKNLFDGPAETGVPVKAKIIHERIALLASSMLEAEDLESILLSYLYTRSDMILEAHKTYASSMIYTFPLIKALVCKSQAIDEWGFVQDLVLRNLLTENQLIDEIRTCTSCHSGLLNIKTSCPSCHSIDIRPQKFIHCFSCGQIGPIPEFLRQERLICSNCHVKLRQIGVDYEKPLEEKICNKCGHFFAMADTKIICLACHHTSSLTELNPRRLYNYKISRNSEYLIRGIDKSTYRNFTDYFKVMDFTNFMATLSWQTKLAERYDTIYFCLMSLEITNENEIVNALGKEDSEHLLSKFFIYLRKLFRDSDLSSRINSIMFFLLPLAKQEGCLIILERLKEAVNELALENKQYDLCLGVSFMTSHEIIQSNLLNDVAANELHARMIDNNLSVIGRSLELK